MLTLNSLTEDNKIILLNLVLLLGSQTILEISWDDSPEIQNDYSDLSRVLPALLSTSIGALCII